MILLKKFFTTTLLSTTLLITSCSNDDGIQNKTLTPSDISSTEDLNTYLENLVNTTEAPGFSVTIAIDDAIAYQNSFGYSNIANQKPYTNSTLNTIASCSKTFVGAATAKAIEQGLFTLETPINELLPIEINNPYHPNELIRVKHLVTHTSGIIDNPDTYIPANYYILPGEEINTTAGNILSNSLGIQQMERVSLEEYLAEFFDEDGDLYSLDNFIAAAPGTAWAYSNNATSLMGYIIEYQSEISFDNYVKTFILTPLNMVQSTYNIYDVDLENLATQYMNPNAAFPRYDNHGYVEGSLISSNNELSYYLLDMMKGVQGNASTLFGENYYDLLFTPLLADDIVPDAFADNHSLFWYTKNGNYMHGGNSLGVSSHIQFKEDGSSGYFIMSNMDGTFHGNDTQWEQLQSSISEAITQYINNL